MYVSFMLHLQMFLLLLLLSAIIKSDMCFSVETAKLMSHTDRNVYTVGPL